MKVIITPQAERDLAAIGDHIARDNQRRATSFVRELIEKCLGLAQFPERFPLIERYRAIGLRRRVHGNYLIFYRVEPSTVRVIHVLPGAIDYAFLLDQEFGED